MTKWVLVVGLVGVLAVWRGGRAAEGSKEAVLRPGTIPVGSLGRPLGDYLTIEGFTPPNRDPHNNKPLFRVEAVNGQRLDKPVVLVLENVDPPDGKRCTLKGYESVRMTGAAPAVVEEAAERGIEKETIPWRMELYFVVLKAVEPADLAVGKGGAK